MTQNPDEAPENGPTASVELPDGLVPVTIQVDPGARGLRADWYLSGRLGRVSRSRIQAMFSKGHVLQGARRLRASFRLHGGETLTVYKPAPALERPLPVVPVLHREPAFVVVDKPGDLTVHPTANACARTLTAFLRALPEGPYHPAHRLDRETSGLVVCGAAGPASAALKSQFAGRTARKTYLALARGRFELPLEVRQPLGLAPGSPIRIKMGVVAGGFPSWSSFTPLVPGDQASLIVCTPHTGRQHQLRAHLEWAGHPVLGDKIYGVPPEWFLTFIESGWTEDLARDLVFHRQMLHAAWLRFTHPDTGEPCDFFADAPPDFREACARLGIPCPPTDELARMLEAACP
jgi:23S rRNA pseudouridine1911/1915/1917 synthase